MSFKLISAECIPLTPALAAEHYALEPSPTERELNPSRLKYLRARADAGQLVSFHWARARLGSRVVRINGQHSSAMLKELNGGFPENLKVHMDTYAVDAPHDLAVLFRQIDARQSSRSSADVSGAYQGYHPDLKDVPKPIAKMAVQGIAFYERWVVGAGVRAGDDQYDLFDNTDNHPFIQWMGELYSIKTPEMKHTPIAAAIYATFTTTESVARTFWQDVAKGGIEYEENAPATVLDSWLKQIKSREEKGKLRLIQGNYYQGAIYAWNAYRESKPIKDIRYKVDQKGFLPVSH